MDDRLAFALTIFGPPGKLGAMAAQEYVNRLLAHR